MSEKAIYAETDMSVSQFIKEADIEWNKLESAYFKGLSMQINYTLPKESSFKADVCLLDKNELVIIYPTENTRMILNAINPHYAFRLEKNTKVAEWKLSKIWDNHNAPRENLQFNHGLLQTTVFIFEPVMIESSWIKNLMKSEEMEVVSLKEQHLENENYVELQFRCRQYNVNKYTKLLSGTIIFDKKRYFVIKEYNVQTEFVSDGLPLKSSGKNSGSD
ncbi:MAG: hypothetical protein LBC74_00930, partial [Planctomycetaceae bacterium]|nr:hypothetical protein [Planctomycetaceae bacterium]